MTHMLKHLQLEMLPERSCQARLVMLHRIHTGAFALFIPLQFVQLWNTIICHLFHAWLESGITSQSQLS